jgi:hypothetical protein
MLLSSEIKAYVMKHVFFYIKVLVLGLNPEDYYFYFLMVFYASNLLNIGIELAPLLSNQLNSFASKVFTRNILDVFIFKGYRKGQNIKYKWKMVGKVEKINTFLKLKFGFLTTALHHYISYLRVLNSEILELLRAMQ